MPFNNIYTTNNNLITFWYKADNHGEFRLGSKEFWELSKNLKDDDEEAQYDPNNVKKRGAGPKISVKKANKW